VRVSQSEPGTPWRHWLLLEPSCRHWDLDPLLSPLHKRELDGADAIDFDPNHPGYIDEEEAALPPISFHGPNGELISEDELDRMSELERAHELNGTLHLLYPDHYPHDYMDWYGLLTDNSTVAEDMEDASHALDVPSTPSTSPAVADRDGAAIEKLRT
jgi:hypothetical protein